MTLEPDRWDEFFDDLYLRSYVSRLEERDAEAEAHAAAALAGVQPPAAVLDAPCGFGRHSIALAKAGFDVTGVDRSPAQLAAARERAGGGENPRFVRADFRDLPFEDASFDLALNLFSSIGYRGEEGDRRTLRELRRVLRPGGALVLETMHRDRLMSVLRETDWEELPDGALVLERRTFDYRAGEIETTHMLIDPGGERRPFTYRLRLYTATELVGLLEEAGFGTVDLYGSVEGAELTRETRLVAVARP